MEWQRVLRRLGVFVLVVAGVIVLAGCSVPTASAPAASPSNGLPTNTLSVSGVGEASAAPDIAFVDLGVVTSGPDVGPAVEQSNQRTAAVVEAVKQAGVDPTDIKTSSFNVWSEERFDRGPVTPEDEPAAGQVIYRVENGLRVTVRDVEQLGTVIQAGLDAGANQVRGVNFSIEDTSAVEEEARAQAVENARARAANLAEQMSVTLGDPVVVSEGSGGGVPYPAFETAVGLGGGGGPPISSGELTVRVQVNVTFEIK
jgi:uncharacterized protein YggE